MKTILSKMFVANKYRTFCCCD